MELEGEELGAAREKELEEAEDSEEDEEEEDDAEDEESAAAATGSGAPSSKGKRRRRSKVSHAQRWDYSWQMRRSTLGSKRLRKRKPFLISSANCIAYGAKDA